MEHVPEPAARTPTQQSAGAVIAIVVIMLMIIIGAFYSWNKRIAEQRALTATSTGQQL